MVWTISVISCSSLLLFFLVWKEARRANKAWRTARIVLSVSAVVSLALMAFPLTIQKQQVASTSGVALLTPGFNKDTLLQVVSSQKIRKIYTADKSVNFEGAVFVPDLTKLKDSGQTLHLFGNGLTEKETTELAGLPIRFYPPSLQNTFTAIGWHRQLPSGEALVVQGRFVNGGASPVKIILAGFGASLDSATITGNTDGLFTLRTVPAHINRAVFTLLALAGADTLASEPVPLEVLPTPPLKILVLASSPDFENKFLKAWLAEHQFQFAVRTTISKGKYDKEFINLSPVSLEGVTPDLLQKFDLVVADMPALRELSPPGVAALRGFLSGRGGGLVVKADNALRSPPFYAAPFPLSETRDSLQHLVKAVFPADDHRASPLKIAQPLYIKPAIGTRPLVYDHQGRTIAASVLWGQGKIVMTTVPNSFVWQLAGSTTDYYRYWTTLLTNAARPAAATGTWHYQPALPTVDEEVHLQWQGETEDLPLLQVGGAAVYPEQDPFLAYRWRGRFWPAAKGWVSAMAGQGTANWWYVYGKADWQGVKAAGRIAATRQYAALHSPAGGLSPVAATTVATGFPKIWLFLLLLLCCGLLWLEKKRQRS